MLLSNTHSSVEDEVEAEWVDVSVVAKVVAWSWTLAHTHLAGRHESGSRCCSAGPGEGKCLKPEISVWNSLDRERRARIQTGIGRDEEKIRKVKSRGSRIDLLGSKYRYLLRDAWCSRQECDDSDKSVCQPPTFNLGRVSQSGCSTLCPLTGGGAVQVPDQS